MMECIVILIVGVVAFFYPSVVGALYFVSFCSLIYPMIQDVKFRYQVTIVTAVSLLGCQLFLNLIPKMKRANIFKEKLVYQNARSYHDEVADL
jgi:hypothetical protein